MNENEFLLLDRVAKIKSIIYQYGIDNFYISFSGGKDSTVLSWLIDYAIPWNEIPRVYANTGIELNMIKNFVEELAKKDKRIHIIKPSVPIKQMLEEEGYPFKSKEHAHWVWLFKKFGTIEGHTGLQHYLDKHEKQWCAQFRCPKKLLYQFEDDFKIKLSDHCCIKMKEEPLIQWSKKNKKPYYITGLRRAEGGRRRNANCLTFSGKKLKTFQPLSVVSDEWEEWLIETYNIKICDIYKPPYNFKRTGCKGCPFARDLQKELEALEEFFPAERKQCEYIWKPIYDEYRRIGYRLKK